MKVTYTEAAQQELTSYHERQQQLLEEIIAEKKFVFGDDVVEITASDIREMSNYVRYIRPVIKRNNLTNVVSQMYIVIGIILTIGAAFYNQIKQMIKNDQTQAMILAVGVSMITVGFTFNYWYKLKRRRQQEEYEHYLLNSNTNKKP